MLAKNIQKTFLPDIFLEFIWFNYRCKKILKKRREKKFGFYGKGIIWTMSL